MDITTTGSGLGARLLHYLVGTCPAVSMVRTEALPGLRSGARGLASGKRAAPANYGLSITSVFGEKIPDQPVEPFGVLDLRPVSAFTEYVQLRTRNEFEQLV